MVNSVGETGEKASENINMALNNEFTLKKLYLFTTILVFTKNVSEDHLM
jgi:hypothetical protein